VGGGGTDLSELLIVTILWLVPGWYSSDFSGPVWGTLWKELRQLGYYSTALRGLGAISIYVNLLWTHLSISTTRMDLSNLVAAKYQICS
jgi:hypothetical protein